MSLRTGATRKVLASGATKQLAGGISQRFTGAKHTGTKKFTTTKSGGSSSAAGEQDKYLRVNPITKETKEARPDPLIRLAEEEAKDKTVVDASKADKATTKADKASGSGQDKAAETSQPKIKTGEEKKDKEKDASVSMQSDKFNSSLLETSEDEDAKMKAKKEEEKAKKKGLTEEELSEIIDIELCETDTMIIMNFPSSIINDANENQAVIAQNDQYKQLLNNKIYKGDNYTQRGSQTMNLGQKPREVQYLGFR
jgi:hypothetical protein